MPLCLSCGALTLAAVLMLLRRCPLRTANYGRGLTRRDGEFWPDFTAAFLVFTLLDRICETVLYGCRALFEKQPSYGETRLELEE